MVCAIHPQGLAGGYCGDSKPDPNLEEELWAPTGYRWGDDGDLVAIEKPIDLRKWQILNTHPLFTGVCPECNYQFDPKSKNWDCPQCGWKYELTLNT
jgi:hypothetical protein